ncbi:PrsW family glutamic-type intramembrane protease [Streptomyces sp. NPDC090442]|uniref:PrsW family glutamic-type intramembrane protease n=1 Tax=Streptomyces sp. NPDC090442 TaxID=3365962 RepID=UPI00382D135D
MRLPAALPVRDDPLVRARALLIGRLAIALYLLELVLDLTRPRLTPDEPTLSIFYKLPGASGSFAQLLAMPRAVFWTVLAGIAAGVLLQVYAALTRPSDRRSVLLTWLTLGCLLLPFGLIPLSVMVEYFPFALACLPSTAVVLLLLHGGVRFARVPLGALLAAFAWGALIVFGFGRACSGLVFGTLNGYLGGAPSAADPGRMLKSLYHVMGLTILHLDAVDELVVAAGVVLLLLMFRHRVTDVVTGLSLGAAVGLGYNFVESTLLIKIYGSLGSFLGVSGGFEYWIRQSIGLLGGQVTFGALLGAGLGLAAKARRRGLVATAALVAAIGGTSGAETVSGWLSRQVQGHVELGSALDTLVISPLLWLLPQLPFTALAVALLVHGLRERGRVMRAALQQEAAVGPAVTQAELPVLASAARRFWAVVGTWRWYGRGAARALHRLQTAQLELAGRHVQNDPTDTSQGDDMRTRTVRLKGDLPAVTR